MVWREKVETIAKQYQELAERMADPQVANDINRYRVYAQTLAEIEPLVDKYQRYQRLEEELEEERNLLKIEKDAEMRRLLEEDIERLKSDLEKLSEEIKIMLLPKDPRDEKNTLVEIRAG
ncbi:MAG: PCRF domain-containing protein, partial [Candidatus Caldatribacteriaceae bacterium]